MRIAFAVPMSEEFGFGRYLRLLLEGLARVDSENEYVLFAVGDSARSIRTRPAKTEVVLLPPRRPLLLWRQRVLAPACLDRGIDLLHFHNSTIWLRKPIRTIVTLHHVTYAFPREEQAVSWIERRYVRFLCRRIAADANAVITVSQTSAADLRRFLGIEARVVPFAPDPVFRPASEREVAATREKFDLRRPYFFFAGALGIRKNLPRMIRAFARFNSARSHEFVIAGSPPSSLSYRAESFRGLPLDDVRFLGFVPGEDLPALYTGASALFYATSYEGFGNPILEAFACRCPVVASDRSAHPETAGGAAVLANPEDEAALAAALARALDERDSLIERGLRRVSDYSVDRTARATLDVYRSV